MDELDKGILNDLVKNCRITYEELSRKHGVSANAIRKRVLKLEETGIVDSYTVTLSPAMTNTEHMFGFLKTDGSIDEIEVLHQIAQNKCIIAASSYTDGTYALVGEYANTNELMELGMHLRALKSVSDIEMHTILQKPGGKMDLTSLHLRVLKCLTIDAKMSIMEITEKTGLTASRIRKLLQEIHNSDAIRVTANIELGAASDIPFLIRMTYNQSKMTPDKLMSWLWDSYPLPLWQLFISASEPVAIALLAVDTLTELDEITRQVRSHDFIDTVTVTISTHHKYFEGIRFRKMLEMVEEIELR